MAVQRTLARLSSVLICSNRDLIPSFQSSITASPTNAKERPWSSLLKSSDLIPLTPSTFKEKKLVVFGEQHQQPQVLKAQLQCISALSSSWVIIMEHFNYLQSPLLEQYSRSEITSDELIREYRKSKEGFNIIHYLPILDLARDLGIPVLGGFPPREWAGVINSSSIAKLRTLVDGPPGFNWSGVGVIEKEGVMYLRSLLSGNPPHDPEGEDTRSFFDSGILAAQSFKDCVLAHHVDVALKSGKNVFVVCGLGHAEYGLNFTSRLKECQREDILLLASKEWESTEFEGDEQRDGDKVSDIIIPYHAIT